MARGKNVDVDGRKMNVVRLSAACGFCITGHHKDCIPELEYFTTVWLCGCECAKEYQYSGDKVN